ncbi:hypothetical protein DH2020_007020 [Rehmannia glutinosa]|uniref:Exostosin GT47 domain-containing protein n=1 Tax=Rehmannia glutinosa TaxID=99300 RepID=A0ABR0TXC7_REHGL
MASKTPSLFFTLSFLSLISFTFFYLHFTTAPPPSPNPRNTLHTPENSIKVYISPLPRSLNYGLLEKYWALTSDKRIGSEVDNDIRNTLLPKLSEKSLPYPENPIIKQYSAEYWILGDLLAPEESKGESIAKRVLDSREADVIFVPFFATLSAELQLVVNKGVFRKRVEENGDYVRQRMVVDLVKKSEAWQKSGGRDHVFVLTGCTSRKTRSEIPFFTSKEQNIDTGVDSFEKTMGIIDRSSLELLWKEGFPNATGKEQSIKGMRTSEFCLHPAGDTPTSCRLFDAIQSLCIPVIVSDDIELPFEGMVDYSEFSVFVAVSDALRPNWLVSHLRNYSRNRRIGFAKIWLGFNDLRYDNGHPGGIGPTPPDGAVNHIWKKFIKNCP